MFSYKQGKGLINSVIDKLPFEVHLPGYQYCGPGTKLQKRLKRGDPGINRLDAACKEHDIAYDKFRGDGERTKADQLLAKEALKRVIAKDASLSERAAATAVTTAMGAKIGISKLGGGLLKASLKKSVKKRKKKSTAARKRNLSKKLKKKVTVKKTRKTSQNPRKCCAFKKLIKQTKATVKRTNPKTHQELLSTAIAAANDHYKQNVGKITEPRLIPIPKIGGMLPLVPIFAGLSALGTLIGGSAGVIRAVKATDEAKREFEESKRHNKVIESIAIGQTKTGSGIYLRPYKRGYGIYLQPFPKSKNY